MDEFPPNSKRMRETEPREKIKPVTSAKAVRRKRGLGRQFKATFFSGNGRDVFSYMIEEVAIPRIRDMFHDAMQSGIDRLIYGDARRPRRTSGPMGTSSVGHVDYRGMGVSSATSPQRILSRQSKARHDFDELVIASAQDANEVLDRMFDILSRYGEVTVAHLYELTGIQSSHTDMKWGWTSLRGARAMRLAQGGYLLDLPRPEELG
jgi:hypothetical protein